MNNVDIIGFGQSAHNPALRELRAQVHKKAGRRIGQTPRQETTESKQRLMQTGIVDKIKSIQIIWEKCGQLRFVAGVDDQSYVLFSRQQQSEIVQRDECLSAHAGRGVVGSDNDPHTKTFDPILTVQLRGRLRTRCLAQGLLRPLRKSLIFLGFVTWPGGHDLPRFGLQRSPGGVDLG